MKVENANELKNERRGLKDDPGEKNKKGKKRPEELFQEMERQINAISGGKNTKLTPEEMKRQD